MDVLFVLYAGLIPAVPLIGIKIFKRRKETSRRNVCIFLFIMQIIISTCYVIAYFSR